MESITKTVEKRIETLAEEICDKYCKYPAICQAERKDPDDAEQLLYDTYCAKCPLSKL